MRIRPLVCWLCWTLLGMFLLCTQDTLEVLKLAMEHPSRTEAADAGELSDMVGGLETPNSTEDGGTWRAWFDQGGANDTKPDTPAEGKPELASDGGDKAAGGEGEGSRASSWFDQGETVEGKPIDEGDKAAGDEGEGSSGSWFGRDAPTERKLASDEAYKAAGDEGEGRQAVNTAPKDAGRSLFGNWFGSEPLPSPCDLLCYVAGQQVSLVRLAEQARVWVLNWKDNTSVVVETPVFPVDVPLKVGLVWWGVVICFGFMMGIILVVVLKPRRARKRKTGLELRQEQRILQEREEQECAIEAVEIILDDPTVSKEEEWGSRLQKYWFMQKNESMDLVVTIAPLSKHCFLDVGHYQTALNEFLLGLCHPYLQPISYIKHYRKNPSDLSDQDKVVIAQPFWRRGSLRDVIYGEEHPNRDWAVKYLRDGTPLPPEKVAKYGMQILQAITYLYKHTFSVIALRPLEHIHVGNIYLDGEGSCRLGGYENTLLGYKTCLYRKILRHECLPDIDIILFGHVMYEMFTGTVLSGLVPTEKDYQSLEEGDVYRECKEELRFVFTRKGNGRFAHSIKQIKRRPFFASTKPAVSVLEQVKVSVLNGAKSRGRLLSEGTKGLVRKLRPARQHPHVPVITAPVPAVSKHISPRGKSQSSAAESAVSAVLAVSGSSTVSKLPTLSAASAPQVGSLSSSSPYTQAGSTTSITSASKQAPPTEKKEVPLIQK